MPSTTQQLADLRQSPPMREFGQAVVDRLAAAMASMGVVQGDNATIGNNRYVVLTGATVDDHPTLMLVVAKPRLLADPKANLDLGVLVGTPPTTNGMLAEGLGVPSWGDIYNLHGAAGSIVAQLGAAVQQREAAARSQADAAAREAATSAHAAELADARAAAAAALVVPDRSVEFASAGFDRALAAARDGGLQPGDQAYSERVHYEVVAGASDGEIALVARPPKGFLGRQGPPTTLAGQPHDSVGARPADRDALLDASRATTTVIAQFGHIAGLKAKGVTAYDAESFAL